MEHNLREILRDIYKLEGRLISSGCPLIAKLLSKASGSVKELMIARDKHVATCDGKLVTADDAVYEISPCGTIAYLHAKDVWDQLPGCYFSSAEKAEDAVKKEELVS